MLIGNTGGDRLIDWVGEFNSYLVPFAPFGVATVSRTLQPQLPEFLYALSAGDGADPTRRDADSRQRPDPRNGEPDGELGLVLQKDFAWQDQTGAPADPQAGNIPGGTRDVLRSADFNDGTAQGFVVDSREAGGAVQRHVRGGADRSSGDAVSLFYADAVLPSYFEMPATINAVKPIAGYKANAYIIFDYSAPPTSSSPASTSRPTRSRSASARASGWQVLASINTDDQGRTRTTTCCWR